MPATGFSFHMHFCGGHLQSYAMYTAAEACEMNAPITPACHQAATITHQSCCEDQWLQSEQADQITPAKVILETVESLVFIPIISLFFNEEINLFIEKHSFFPPDTGPPHYAAPFTILYQAFLI
jgi:hypothetical protein